MTEQEEEGSELLGSPIVIDDRPLCFWSSGSPSVQIEFLNGIDPDYFTYLAETHEPNLDGAHDLHAAVALRVGYAHAIEGLFVAVGAAVQAPECPAGWMLRYLVKQLEAVIEKIHKREHVENRLDLRSVSWRTVAEAVSPWPPPGDRRAAHIEATATALRAFANELLNTNFRGEYNSLKHGFRAQAGDGYFAMQPEASPGVPAPGSQMRIMMQSRHGSFYLRAVPVKTHHWVFERQRINWDPRVLARRLPLIAALTDNILSFLKWMSGAPSDTLGIRFLTTEAVSHILDDPERVSASSFSFKPYLEPDWIPDMTPDQIRAAYRETEQPQDESK